MKSYTETLTLMQLIDGVCAAITSKDDRAREIYTLRIRLYVLGCADPPCADPPAAAVAKPKRATKFKVGKCYVDGSGKVTTPLKKSSDPGTAFPLYAGVGAETRSWNSLGRFYAGSSTSRMDLHHEL